MREAQILNHRENTGTLVPTHNTLLTTILSGALLNLESSNGVFQSELTYFMSTQALNLSQHPIHSHARPGGSRDFPALLKKQIPKNLHDIFQNRPRNIYSYIQQIQTVMPESSL